MQMEMNRREAIAAGMASGLLTLALGDQASSEENRNAGLAKKRNVLLIVADDLGMDLPCFGNDKVHAPNLEKLAAEGIRFNNAFCTTASCSPSRSVILTGLHNHTNGMYGLQHDTHNFSCRPWVQGLPKLLKENGYVTALFGKYHLQPDSVFPWDFYKAGSKRNHLRLANFAEQFLQDVKDRPFFLEVAFSDPHRAGRNYGNDLTYEGLPNFDYKPDEVAVPPFLPNTPEVRQDLVEYYQAVSRLDHGVGLALDALHRSGHDEDTLVIFISDNGMPFPGAKCTLYDSGVHLPMIVRSPEHKNGTVNNTMISFTDLVPTILDWTGTSLPEKYVELHGRSIMPFLDHEDSEGRDEVYFSHQFHEITMYYPCRGVRTRKYKYILNLFPDLTFPMASDLGESKTWQAILKQNIEKMGVRNRYDFLHHPAEELYDLEKDPIETQNVAEKESYRPVLEELRQKVVSFRERTKDPWFVESMTFEPEEFQKFFLMG